MCSMPIGLQYAMLPLSEPNLLIAVPGKLIGILYWTCDNPGCHYGDLAIPQTHRPNIGLILLGDPPEN